MLYADLVYSNARIKTLENNSMTPDRISRMINAESISDAVKVLSEIGYGNGITLSDSRNYNELLKSEDDKLIKILKEVIPEKGGLEILLLEQDEKNLKSCMKLKYSKLANKEDLLRTSGFYDVDAMYEQIMQDNYNSFSHFIAKALVEIDYEFALGQKRPAFIDYTIEKAINNTCLEILKTKGSKKLLEFYMLKLDFTNFSSFLRARRLKLPLKVFEDMFLEGGNIELSIFSKNYEQSLEQIQEVFRHRPESKVYFNAVNELKEYDSLIVFEKERDDYLVSLFSCDKNEIFEIAPIVAYYLQKKLEIKMVRLALVNINNDIDKQEFKKRLRACFSA